MIEKRFTYLDASRNKYIGSFFCNEIPLTNQEVVDFLNENKQLKQENEWLKSEIQKLYNFVKIDVDHNIEVYPKSLMEPILEILKIIGDVK